MFVNFLYDALNDFGKLAAAGDFPNTINMGDATAEQMAVDLKLPDGPLSGGPVTLTVKGCGTEGGTYENIVISGSVTAAMIADGYGLPVPKTAFKYLKASIAGTFTGSVQAIINSYKGI
jgi:hypothetical protein